MIEALWLAEPKTVRVWLLKREVGRALLERITGNTSRWSDGLCRPERERQRRASDVWSGTS